MPIATDTQLVINSLYSDVEFDNSNWIDYQSDGTKLHIGVLLFRGNDGNFSGESLFSGKDANTVRGYSTVDAFFTSGGGVEIGSDTGSIPGGGGAVGGYNRVAIRCGPIEQVDADTYRWRIISPDGTEVSFGNPVSFSPQHTIQGCLWYARLGADGASSSNIIDSTNDALHLPFKFEAFAQPDATANGPVKISLPSNQVIFTMEQKP